METYNGHVRTPTDAIILFEACRMGMLPRVQRRLSEKERMSIKSGSVFVWDEREAGMRRWTDGKSWSASRVSGSFLTYREMEGKRSGSSVERSTNRDGVPGQDGDSDGGPDGYRYKPDGLMKQSFSIKTQQGQHLHLISYFSRSSAAGQGLMQPSSDPTLRHIRPEKGMYPDSTVHEQSSIPAVTRGPMSSPGYAQAPPTAAAPYARPPAYSYAAPTWAPPSPMHTPPPNGAYSPFYQHAQQPPYPGQPPMQPVHHYPPPPPGMPYGAPPGASPYDRPPPMSGNGMPPQYGQPPAPNGYPTPYAQHPPYHHPHPYPPYQSPHHEEHPAYPSPHQQAYEGRPPHDMYHHAPPGPHPDPHSIHKDQRHDSHHNAAAAAPLAPHLQHRAPVAAQPAPAPPASAPTSGQTIPSISAMLNGGDSARSPGSSGTRSPGGTLRGLQDIPSHKLGFEASRDVHVLRNLDKTTFKQY